MKKIPALLLASMALLFPYWHSMAQEEETYKVVVHPDNPYDSITKQKLSQLLLKKSARWEDGKTAFPVDLESKSPVRSAFTRAIHGRSVASIKNYWQRQIFSGRQVPPPEVATDAEVLAHVRGNPGAVGYVSGDTQVGNLKVLPVSN